MSKTKSPTEKSRINIRECPSLDETKNEEKETLGKIIETLENLAPHGENPQASGADSPAEPAGSAGQKPQTTTTIAGYKILWELERDALSATYACQREGLAHMFAMRVFDRRMSSEMQVKQIQKAAREAAELTHYSVVTVYECGVDDLGTAFVVTDLVESHTLAQVLESQKRLDVVHLLSIATQVCDALIEAHSRNIYHANLSPTKILLPVEDENDQIKITGFGMPADPILDAPYLSPEQRLKGGKPNPRWDIYSLGCIMHELLVGRPPFVGTKISSTSLNLLHELANQYSPDSPEHKALKLLDCIIVKCLQEKPGKRFQNASELRRALNLVDSCIRGGSTKRLPKNAEKLLLFRFLDLFDRKLFACMMIYLLAGQMAVRFVGELQLQKFIDQAELSRLSSQNREAQKYWELAAGEAAVLHKPQSLQAAIAWEFGDSYLAQMYESQTEKQDRKIRELAVAQYEKALPYYQKGTYHISSTADLLRRIAFCWAEPEDRSGNIPEISSSEIETLYRNEQYAKLVEVMNKYTLKYRVSRGDEIAEKTVVACNKVAISSPDRKALRHFQQGMYYQHLCSAESPIWVNLDTCKNRLNLKDKPGEELVYDTIKDGDILATMGEIYAQNLSVPLIPPQIGSELEETLKHKGSFNSKRAQALENALAFYEKHNLSDTDYAAPLNAELAKMRAAEGKTTESIAAFERCLGVKKAAFLTQKQMELFTDLLWKEKQFEKGSRILEQYICTIPVTTPEKVDSNTIDTADLDQYHPMFLRLIQFYAASNQRDKALKALRRLAD